MYLRGDCMTQGTAPKTGVVYFYVLNPEGGFDNPRPLLTDVTFYYPNGDVMTVSRNIIRSESDILSHISPQKSKVG